MRGKDGLAGPSPCLRQPMLVEDMSDNGLIRDRIGIDADNLEDIPDVDQLIWSRCNR